MPSALSVEPLDLTIAIPARNEERNLPDCLRAIGRDFAKHVVLLDSGSTDRTCDIAREHGAEVLSFRWNGQFPKKRNWFLREHTPKPKIGRLGDQLTPEARSP